MLKFDRQEFKDTLAADDSVDVRMSGKWVDEGEFEAYDCTGIKNVRVHYEHRHFSIDGRARVLWFQVPRDEQSYPSER